jgi:SAM-dependent methyltransferase
MSSRHVLDAQRAQWERTYAERPEFFGQSASEPARAAMDRFEADNVRSLLELGSGQGRDTLFFLAGGLAVTALDYAEEGLEQIRRKGVEAQIAASLTLLTADVREPLPINDSTFDACYSHMLFNMALATHELESLVAELHRVVRPGGLVVYTARNTSDSHFGAGIDHGDGMFEMGGFIVHFFDRALITRLAKGFELLDAAEYEEGRLPRRLFSVTMRREPMT